MTMLGAPCPKCKSIWLLQLLRQISWLPVLAIEVHACTRCSARGAHDARKCSAQGAPSSSLVMSIICSSLALQYNMYISNLCISSNNEVDLYKRLRGINAFKGLPIRDESS
jgi:hypothetical protein